MNDEPLSFGHGAPLRLRNEAELGFKQVKWVSGMGSAPDFADVGGGSAATTKTTSLRLPPVDLAADQGVSAARNMASVP